MFDHIHTTNDVVAGRYRIVSSLGQGSSGTTYEAEDVQTYQRVALKVMSFRGMQGWKQLELFEREAQVLSHLEHPGIPQYLDYFQVDSDRDRLFYLVQALAPGRSLAALVERGWQSTEAETKRIASEVLNILIYLHGLTPPIIHRDIKPHNIIRGQDGCIYLVDFGSVQAVLSHATAHGSTIVGTYGYMAPEQFRSQAYGATDLHGLGATLIFLLTGCHPGDLPQKRLKLMFRDNLQIEIKPHFASWLEQMTEPIAEERFITAQRALAALKSVHLEKKSHDTSSAVEPSDKPPGSRIQLKRTQTKFALNIPPIGLQTETFFIGATISVLLWNVLVLLKANSAPPGGGMNSSILILCAVLLSVLGLRFSAVAIFELTGRTRVEMNEQQFRIKWQTLWSGRQVLGKVSNLSKAVLQASYTRGWRQVDACVLPATPLPHKFGEMLTNPEKKWIVQELNAFLEEHH
ncbi:Serine/threonine-protein kinase F [Acaryochloris thomasi RCC1774]|uniref:non-specific serine/threonine protein kinase n=1 Tax=Acaryochloris thomasi RCC1774 TaxID=1764569 RepID=A0A2W1JA84_9CYAN|nr:serine/threonine-protein kinase [Acaryochloris thomasi]PZD71080.1 Serine/threonine-protein kinase F [Acaryochloris thomasi RCC1774]